MNIETKTLNKSNLGFDTFDKQYCYCTCLHKMFKVNHLRVKYNHYSAAPLMPSLLFVFSSEVLNSSIKSCFDRVVFQDAFCEESFSICLQCLHL